MSTQLTHFTPNVHLVGGIPKTTSHNIAQVFGRRHKNVLRAIENLDCSDEFNRLNFEPVKYLDEKGQSQPMYELTRDGFTFLVMGFTGKEAARYKEAYIAAFNRMAEQLQAAPAPEAQPVHDESALLTKIVELQDRLIRELERQPAAVAIQKPGARIPWTAAEDERLLQLRQDGLGAARIAFQLGRTYASIACRLWKLTQIGDRHER